MFVDWLEQISRRLANLKPTVFTKFSVLALEHNAINLGQGFPNFDGPEYIKEAAIEAINTVGKNQYARGHGIPALNAAIAERFNKETGLTVDPEAEVTVTSGCSEAIAATMIGLINSGDEVILFSPFYDSYEATLAMVDAKIKSVTLRPPDFAVPVEELKSAFSSNTRAILVNTPHNPTGKIFSRTELELIASLCKEHDALAISDEVYDKLVRLCSSMIIISIFLLHYSVWNNSSELDGCLNPFSRDVSSSRLCSRRIQD